MTAVTQTLARFAVEQWGTKIPRATRAVVRQRFAALVGLATVGSRARPADLARRTLGRFSNSADVGLLGLRERIGLCDAPVVTAAAMVSGLAELDGAVVADWVDGPVVAAALAAAEHVGAAGPDLLDAIAVGTEVGLRVERLLAPALAEGGWLPGAVAGRLGAAAAAGRLLDLSQGRLVSALGLAGTQVAGFAGSATTPAGVLAGGKAAGDGIEAAVLARAGFSGPAAPIEGRRGLAAVLMPGGADLAGMVDALGERWFIDDLAGDGGVAGQLSCAATVAVALDMDGQAGVGELLTTSRSEGAEHGVPG